MDKNQPDTTVADAALSGQRIGVLVTGGYPHPTEGASTILFFHYISALVAAGANVCCLVVVPKGRRDDGARAFLSKKLGCRAEVCDEESANALEIERFGVRDRAVELSGVVQPLIDFRPDGLLCFDLAAAALGRLILCADRVVWLGDLLFDTNWYHFTYGVKDRWITLLRLPQALLQRISWERRYKQVLSNYQSVIVSSHSSEERLRKMGIACRYEPYPWPPLAGGGLPSFFPAKPTFLFFGSLAGLGSRAALSFLTRQLYPRLVKSWGVGCFEIRIAGRARFTGSDQRQVDACKEIVFLGFVDNLAAEIAACHAVIAPMDVPVGNRSRILTAMSCGALVIAHQNAALGNCDLQHQISCFLASTADEFVEQMRKAADFPDYCKEIALAGKQMYENRFAPRVAAQALVKAFSGKVSRPVNGIRSKAPCAQ